jgi:hypothetical protein
MTKNGSDIQEARANKPALNGGFGPNKTVPALKPA